jgi:hypothetical protein
MRDLPDLYKFSKVLPSVKMYIKISPRGKGSSTFPPWGKSKGVQNKKEKLKFVTRILKCYIAIGNTDVSTLRSPGINQT